MARPRKFTETTRRALIRDAAEQILAGGVDSVSLRPLAAKHGCSTTAIYTMFGSRDGLIAAVRDEAIVSYRRAQDAALTPGPPLPNLLAMGQAARRWALAYPELYHVIVGRGGPWRGSRRHDGREVPDPAELAETAMGPIHELIHAALREGTFHGGSAVQIGASLWTGVHGWLSIEMVRPVIPHADPDAAYDRHVRALLRAWCADTPFRH
ncbi:TetR/AcrR family transcriptional regulator [Kocuria sp.]|uniref:TetR/AcrR family transcriptional regulator n=1 Tax=Kocuria sp. TaxID=1871328 RepID=UPI0026DD0D27|nr:TetR/AcrR family transcriptional regulator [Kocuria sp.]MDO4919027.1 TetR/AcrR family transcriptional regulator [Kocuria sp.]